MYFPETKIMGKHMSCFFPGSLFPRPVIHAKQFSRERPYCGPSHADRANSNKKKPLYLFFDNKLWTVNIICLCFFCIDRIELHRIYHEVIFPSQHASLYQYVHFFGSLATMEKNEMLFYISHYDIALWGHNSILSIS